MSYFKAIQGRLVELGFNPGPIDGLRGPKTDAAIVAFKRSVGLRPRPYLGPLTIAALMTRPSERRGQAPWMAEASAIRGLHEARDTSLLRQWFDKSVSWIDPREVAWCGAFVATCHRKALPGIDLPKNSLGARNWQSWGQEVKPILGATLVFWRGSKAAWQGHVGFYHGEDATHFHVLGGNQRNSVNVTRIAKKRLLSARWPRNEKVTGKPVMVASNGTPISNNEA